MNLGEMKKCLCTSPQDVFVIVWWGSVLTGGIKTVDMNTYNFTDIWKYITLLIRSVMIICGERARHRFCTCCKGMTVSLALVHIFYMPPV